jgi:SagB-type dehydrogenase family enzyme
MSQMVITSWLAATHLEPAESVRFDRVGNKWAITRGAFQLSFGLPAGPTRDILNEICGRGVSLEVLAATQESGDAVVGSPVEQIGRLWRQGLLVKAIYDGDEKVAILHNYGDADLLGQPLSPSGRIIMAGDACLRKTGGMLLIESASCGAYLSLISGRVQRLYLPWLSPMSLRQWAEQALPQDVIIAIANCLLSIGALREVEENSEAPKEIGNWSFADRMLHARSRLGRHIGEYGRHAPVPSALQDQAVSSTPSRPKIELPRPEMNTIIANDRTFSDVLESRRSNREPAQPPLSKEHLSEFLYRSARVTGYLGSGEHEITLRPYPSGGGLHELEIYPLVNQCTGLAPGLYRYDPYLHCLEHVAPPSVDTAQLLGDARRATRIAGEPQILFLIAARFAHVNTKYQSVAYSLILKNLGGLFQTMYLVATAMGLAACALGGGSSDVFCRLASTEYWQESTVGEFLLAQGGPECQPHKH